MNIFLMGQDPSVGDEEVGNHFEPYKKCVQVKEFSFKIKWSLQQIYQAENATYGLKVTV